MFSKIELASVALVGVAVAVLMATLWSTDDRPIMPAAAPQLAPTPTTDVAPLPPSHARLSRQQGSEVPAAAQGRSTLTISGLVLDEVGERLPDIELIASPAGVLADGGERVDRERKTRSDRDGVYRFEQLDDGEYEIRNRPVAPYLEARIRVRAGLDSANLVVPQARAVWVYGTVESTRGVALAGVSVMANGQAREVAYTDGAGRYVLYVALRGGAQRPRDMLSFTLDGYRDKRVRLTPRDLQRGEQVRLRTVRLEPIVGVAAVRGTVVASPDEAPVAGAHVLLHSADFATRYQTESDESGRFVLTAVAIGDYALTVSPAGAYRDHRAQRLRVTGDGADLRIVLEPLRFTTLSGRMVDPAGNPVSGFTLWLRSVDAGTYGPRTVTGDQGGYFVLDNVPVGELRFTTDSAPHMSVTGIKAAAGANEVVQLALDWGRYALAGRAVDALGQPVAGAQVRLTWSRQDGGVRSRTVHRTTADTDGRFRFSQLGPGPHAMEVRAPGFRRARLEPALGANAAELLVQLRALAR